MRNALRSLPWVRKVQVDFARKEAVVTAEQERYDEKEMLAALEKAGFPGQVVK